MVVFQARICLSPAHRLRVVQSLSRILGPTRASPGCVSSQLCADVEDENALAIIEEWSDLHSLRMHLDSDFFRVVLSALDFSSSRPEVRFDTIADSKGIAFITACRASGNSCT
jgi:quinol monooxygenase YgiN